MKGEPGGITVSNPGSSAPPWAGALLEPTDTDAGYRGPRQYLLSDRQARDLAEGLAALHYVAPSPTTVALLQLHTREHVDSGRHFVTSDWVCGECNRDWPCATAQILGVTA